jgi:membrane-bound serine protease (ClpP class)
VQYRLARLALAGALIVFGALSAFGSVAASTSAPQRVVRLDLDQAVQPLSASYVVGGIKQAARDGAAAILLRIDTPGGLGSSMRRMVGAILASRVPVVCWVGPQGARAASAGAFILLGCHYATMAPGTNVGAAHPVGVQGRILAGKVTNDAAAFIRSIAEERGRNADWAEEAVRDSVSVPAREALKLHVIDAIAGSATVALQEADGRRVGVEGQTMPLSITAWPAHITNRPMAPGLGLLGSLVDPNIAFLLFLAGLAGLIFEALHPGLSVPGILGVLALVLALVMFEMLPVTIAGLVLIVAGVVFLVAELHVPGHGLSATAGVIALVIGGLLLYDAGALVRVSRPLLIGVVIAKAAFFLIVVRKVVAARRMPPPVPRTLVGAEGVATTDLDPVGTVRVRGEEWTASASGPTITGGTRVRVVGEQGLKLTVDSYEAEVRE